ncbi:MAG TPA: site-specific integrase [Solirubrobacteraceae bacterium]|nr:site-specific integrase [Solirubrobacteraceae bacterium]
MFEIYYRPRRGAKPVFERAGADEAKAWALLDQRLAERHKRSARAIDGVPFSDYATEWLENKKALVRPSTYESYERCVNHHLIPAFGDDPIAKLTARHFRIFQAGKLAGNPDIKVGPEDEDVPVRVLAQWTVKQMMRVVRSIMLQAKVDKLIDENPLDDVDDVPPPDQDIVPLTREQSGLLVAQTRPRELLPVLLMLHCGLRFGEVLALYVEDYNRETRSLYVHRTMTRDGKGGWKIGTVKTKAGRRRLTLGEGLDRLLCEHLDSLPETASGQALMFRSSTGKPRDRTSFREKRFNPALVDMRVKLLTPLQLEALLARLPKEYHLLVRVTALRELDGLRTADAVRLHWTDYEPETRTLSFTDTTGCQRREVLPDTIHALLMASKAERQRDRRPERMETGWMFHARRHTHLSAQNLVTLIRDANAELGLWPRTRIHDLRHTYASMQIAAGVNVKLLARRLGHTNAGFTLATYSWLYEAQADSVADTFDLDDLA